MKKIFSDLAMVGILLGLSQPAFGQEKKAVEINIAHVAPKVSAIGQSMERLAEKFGKLGIKASVQHEVKVIEGIKQTGEIAALNALINNKLQLIPVTDGPCANISTQSSIFSVPYLFDDGAQAHKFADNPKVLEVLNNDFHKSKVHLLAIYEHGWKQFFSTTDEIRNAKNLENKKIRAQQSNVNMDFVTALGGTPVPTSQAEVGKQAKAGIIQAVDYPVWVVPVFKFQSIFRNVAMTNHGYGVFYILVNKTMWDGLTPELRTSLADIVWKEREAERKQSQDIAENTINKLREDKGFKYFEPKGADLQSFKDAGKKVFDNFKSKYSDELVKALKDANPGRFSM